VTAAPGGSPVLDPRGGLVVLLDPGRTTPDAAFMLARRAGDEGGCGFLVGNSFGGVGSIAEVASALRAAAPGLPVIQFPASAGELSADVDAVLLLTLVSGRNPQYLIEEQVRAVPFFERHPQVTAISTAYVLIDGGRVSSVEAVTQTRPLPADRPEMVRAHVRAAKLMGMRATYLEAGSGARCPVPPETVAAARDAGAGALFVGGGVTTPAEVRAARAAGADYVVVGTLYERDPSRPLTDLAGAARA
jgi:putative glycerol-1-phosphate prenyltransferase/phosphoglycerol geranylgeranyltransferase